MRSLKRDEQREWQLPDVRTIPQPGPLAALTALRPLEHIQTNPGVNVRCTSKLPGDTAMDGSPPLSDLPGTADTQNLDSAAVQPVENMEGVQEVQATQDGQERQQGAPPVGRNGHANNHHT